MSASPQARRIARERAAQYLFGLEFTGDPWEDGIESFFEGQPVRPTAREYAIELIQGVNEHVGQLDTEIDGALENWTPERVGRLERNILRVALFEIRHQADVPRAVAINEAIEVAKKFSDETAPRFINGVLDRLAPTNSAAETP
jgi:transcription antitermination protein NusB